MELDGFALDQCFSGTYTHTLDAKGRVSLPAKFRKSLPVALKLVPCDNSVYLFTVARYQEWVLEFFENGKPSASSKRDRQRMFKLMSHAEDAEIDSAGRISISPELCKHANLGKEIKIVGMFDHIEIMSPETYEELDSELMLEDD